MEVRAAALQEQARRIQSCCEIADSKLGPTGMKRGDVAKNLNFQVVPYMYAPIKFGSAYCKLGGSAEAPGHERAGCPGAGARSISRTSSSCAT
jgi:hypothetical protein